MIGQNMGCSYLYLWDDYINSSKLYKEDGVYWNNKFKSFNV